MSGRAWIIAVAVTILFTALSWLIGVTAGDNWQAILAFPLMFGIGFPAGVLLERMDRRRRQVKP